MTMEPSIYSYSLCVALPLMVFFGLFFLLAPTPDKAIYRNYLLSRRIMGTALLILAANYSVHFFCGIRFKNVNAAILMNLSTYCLCYWLFSSAMTTLLNRFYITRRRMLAHLGLWVAFSVMSAVVLLMVPDGTAQHVGLTAMATWLLGYGLFLSRRVLVAYRKAVNVFNDTHSDDIGLYIRWLSLFTYWALIFGVGCGLLTFLPDRWVFVWILSSVPFYIYLFCCYQNYLLFYEQVESAMESELDDNGTSHEVKTTADEQPNSASYYPKIAEGLKIWIADEGYTKPGLTLKELADLLHTNRTYLSDYIKTTYATTFRDWIASLRINYAKRYIAENTETTIACISQDSGFLSMSHFIKTFREKEGCTPAKWRESKN